MKIRGDFVSNYSSCSFIIKVNTVDEVKKLREYFKKNTNICNSGYSSIEEASACPWNCSSWINPNNISVGNCLYVDIGEDHYLEVIDQFDRVSSEIKEMGFELYADPDAHYTIGENLPE